MTTSRYRSLSLFLVGCLGLFGCSSLAYQHMNDPSRDAWQKPKEVVAQLGIVPGARVADVGAGGGYFTWYLAEAVGTDGITYAVEIDETGLDIIRKDMQARGVGNVVPILAELMDPKLPAPVDLVFSCDTYHHMMDRVTYFRSVARYLKADGRVAILDFHLHGFFSGLLGHGTAAEEVRREMEAAGYRLIAAFDIIESQHFQVFARTGS
ncbi:MAG TPA: methyltransferase domain-containing protein [Nitrospira sp.]|nr:methyltransferase domain-containing protein [Nitrospira sp.]